MFLRSFFSRLLEISRLIRYWQWQDKIRPLTVSVLILLLFTGQFMPQLKNFLLFEIYLYLTFTGSYLLNAYMDYKDDLSVGKRVGYLFNREATKIVIVGLAIVCLLFPALFADIRILVLNFFMFLLAVLYSCPPVRLKERGIWGLIAASFTQRSPLLFFVFLIPQAVHLILYIFVWQLLLGILREISHLVNDYENDVKTKTTTLAVQIGLPKMEKIVYVLVQFILIYVALPAGYGIFTQQLQGVILTLLLFVFSHEAIYANFYVFGFLNRFDQINRKL